MNYSDLLSSITNWANRNDPFVAGELANFVSFAEDSFNHGMPDRNIAPLRVREMQKTGTITLTNGSGSLPADYLQYRNVRSMASIPRPLAYASDSFTEYAYPDGAAGVSSSFSIDGVSSISVFPPSSPDVEIKYYAKIPSLTDSNPSNWLLAKMPALYLHGALFHLALFTGNTEMLQRSQALVASMIDGLNTTDTMGTYAMSGTRLRMLTP